MPWILFMQWYKILVILSTPNYVWYWLAFKIYIWIFESVLNVLEGTTWAPLNPQRTVMTSDAFIKKNWVSTNQNEQHSASSLVLRISKYTLTQWLWHCLWYPRSSFILLLCYRCVHMTMCVWVTLSHPSLHSMFFSESLARRAVPDKLWRLMDI